MTVVDRLFNLLPGVIRGADAARNEQPLRTLYQVLQAGYDGIHRDIGALYEDWFVETCDPEVTPRIGALVGAAPTNGPSIWSERVVVANTLGWRSRPGAPTTLAQAAAGATGWPATAFDLESGLIMSANVRPAMSSIASVRLPRHGVKDGAPPLSRSARFGAQPQSLAPSAQRYQRNLDTVAVELWTLPVFAVEGGQPGRAGAVLSVHPEGLDCPLFVAPDRFAPRDAPTVADMPRRLTDALLTGFLLDPPPRPPFALSRRVHGVWTPVPGPNLRVGRLDRGVAPDPDGPRDLVVIDPLRGLFAFTGLKRQPAPEDVRVDYVYGFGGAIGARSYAPPVLPAVVDGGVRRIRVAADPPRRLNNVVAEGWAQGLVEAFAGWDGRSDLRIEIVDSRLYVAPKAIAPLAAGVRLSIGALEGVRPVIKGVLSLQGAEGARLTLNGLYLRDRLIGADLSVTARDCTLGLGRARGVELEDGVGSADLELERCITGAVRMRGPRLTARRTIIDGRSGARRIIALAGPGGGACPADITLDHCTLLGEVVADREIDLSSSVVSGPVGPGGAVSEAAFITRGWGHPDYLRLEPRSPDRGRGAFGQDWDSRMRNLDEAITRHLPQGMACAVFLVS
jgi:hypothetical protein